MSKTNVLDKVFEQFLKGNGIFQDREVLRHDYIPNILPHLIAGNKSVTLVKYAPPF